MALLEVALPTVALLGAAALDRLAAVLLAQAVTAMVLLVLLGLRPRLVALLMMRIARS